ncbi:hypothetical protein ABZ782_28105 [Streptomyces asoensis]|uniref:hypothetical protein n=1 Tax=Streptomyces asoensis TaxID=249586 RepID=UPI0033C07879
MNAAEMLPVPKLDALTAEQIDGEACVWCRRRPRDPFALGPRLSAQAGRLHCWHPIAHRRCAAQRAGKVYALHIKTCARCTHRDYCMDAQALHKLALAV